MTLSTTGRATPCGAKDTIDVSRRITTRKVVGYHSDSPKSVAVCTTVVPRLRLLLDVLARVHRCTRAQAAAVVADAVGVTPAIVGTIATGRVRLLKPATLTRWQTALTAVEARYRLPLRYLKAYESACERAA